MEEDRQFFNGRIAEAKILEIGRTVVWLDRSDAECFGRTFISAEENLLEPVLVNEHGKASLEKRLFVEPGILLARRGPFGAYHLHDLACLWFRKRVDRPVEFGCAVGCRKRTGGHDHVGLDAVGQCLFPNLDGLPRPEIETSETPVHLHVVDTVETHTRRRESPEIVDFGPRHVPNMLGEKAFGDRPAALRDYVEHAVRQVSG